MVLSADMSSVFILVLACVVVSMLDCQSRGWGSNPAQAGICVEISAPSAPLVNSAVMSTATLHCWWEDESAREITGHLPSFTEAKKMKLLTLHTITVTGLA